MPVRFLIADDMPAQQKLLATVVLFLGGESKFASNGREVLRLAQEDSFDIVLLDLSMPELGGVAAANGLIEGWKTHVCRPRIIAVTGETDDGTRMLCRAVGMDGFIAKPFSVTNVRKSLKQLLMHGHCWPEGAPRRILDVTALHVNTATKDWAASKEVVQARTHLQELVEKLDTLTPEQCGEKAEQLATFARKHGMIMLAPLMETFSRAAREGEAVLFASKLAEQRADFEHAITAIRSWHHHAPEPLRMSA
jgi:CheY-like chemotaxis protein